MSAPIGFNANNSNSGKKAVHVKWAGKTIALGTFPAAEADEKCARAKALTRAWRSTMRPKPTREWVMLELERLQVRVVSGRLGRGNGGSDSEGDGDLDVSPGGNMDGFGKGGGQGGLVGDSMNGRQGDKNNSPDPPNIPPHRPLVGGGSAAAYEALRADHYRKLAEQKSSSKDNPGHVKSEHQLTDLRQSPLTGINSGQSAGNLIGASGGGAGGGLPQLGLSVNPNQHYEMLKLHHMNLLNEIQETTLMMNLYQQQQLQQQQQQLQQQQQQQQQVKASGLADQQYSLLAQQQAMSHQGGLGNLGFSGSQFSGDANGGGMSNGLNPQQNLNLDTLMRQQPPPQSLPSGVGVGSFGDDIGQMHKSGNSSRRSSSSKNDSGGGESDDEKNDKLEKIKQEIAERQRILEQLEDPNGSKGKRKGSKSIQKGHKRAKKEEL